MTNQIISAAVHDLVRGSGGLFEVTLGQVIAPVNDLTQRVVDELYNLYSSRTSKAHGEFSSAAPPPAQIHIAAYLAAAKPDFGELTAKMMDILKQRAQTRAAAGGGHVFFAHFRRDANDYLLVTIVSDRIGAALTGALVLTEVKHLDLEHFRFAGRIDLSTWQAGGGRYLGFLKGKGDVSDYFREFLGCDAVVMERQDTVRVVEALTEYATETFDDAAERAGFLSRAKVICDRAIKNGKPVEFQALANELTPEDPAPLLEVLTAPERTLTDGFSPHRGALGPLVQFRIKMDSWNMTFGREALLSGDIVYDADNNNLIIRNIPQDIGERLRAERVHAPD
jgi:nucleoid-associated protein